jgi:hypothetical protein
MVARGRERLFQIVLGEMTLLPTDDRSLDHNDGRPISVWKRIKVAHHIKCLFNGSIKPLLLAKISQSKNWKKLPIILYDFFVIFPEKTKNVFCLLLNKTFWSPIFVVIWCITWITCLNDLDRHSNFSQKKIFMKIENVICWYFLCLSI